MARRGAEETRVGRLARDLIRARWRGLDDLDFHDSKQDPRDVLQLTQEAQAYCEARGVDFGGDRVAEIRFFLEEGLKVHTAKGYQADAEHFTHLYFDPSASVTAREVFQQWKADMELQDPKFKYEKWRRTAYPRLAATLIELVDTAAHEAAVAGRTDLVTITPIPEGPPRPRLGCGRAALAGFIALMITCVVVARLLMGATASPHQATTAASSQATIITGIVECSPDPTKAVVGVWVVGSNGGSGWAHFQLLPGHPNIALFDRTLPTGGSYVVHVGCGGTPAHWELALGSVTPVSDSGYHFTCYDSTSDQNPYLGQCRP